jgi:outer membrane protein assembly factor BamE
MVQPFWKENRYHSVPEMTRLPAQAATVPRHQHGRGRAPPGDFDHPMSFDSRNAVKGALLAIGAALLLSSAGCASSSGSGSGLLKPYRIDIPQGNYLTQEMVDQVKPGMRRQQVRVALGSPLLDQMFRDDRWDYVFRYQHANGRSEMRHVTVFFKDDVVSEIRADELPQHEDPSDPALPGFRPSNRPTGSAR